MSVHLQTRSVYRTIPFLFLTQLEIMVRFSLQNVKYIIHIHLHPGLVGLSQNIGKPDLPMPKNPI